MGKGAAPDARAHRFPGRRIDSVEAGFTFVELLVVVGILSILAAIAMPAYRSYVLRAKVAESLVFLGDAKVAVNEFHSRWGRMPVDNGEVGLRPPADLRGTYLRSISVSGGVMVASMDLGKDTEGNAIDRTLTFRPWVNATNPGSPVIWSCGMQDPMLPDDYKVIGRVSEDPVDAQWLPTICRN